MEPQEVSEALRRVAYVVDLDNAPSLGYVVASLRSLVLATDRSLAEAVGRAVAEKIAASMPDFFAVNRGKLMFDTSDSGKGFKGGLVSFGLDPKAWDDAGIIGGILFRCRYDAGAFRSESPGEGDEWEGRGDGGTTLSLHVHAKYYNKLAEGGEGKDELIGTAEVTLDEKEQVTEVVLADGVEDGIRGIVEHVLKHPPEGSLGARAKKKGQAPTTLQGLQKWILQQRGEQTVKREELQSLARAMSQRQERPYAAVMEEVRSYFTSRGWKIEG